MRDFQLRSTPAILTTLKEPPKNAKKRKVNWQRLSFIIAAIAFVIYVAIRVYFQLAVIHADGQLELHKQIIHFPSDVQIESLYVAEGEQIQKGDTLFKYSIPQDNRVTTSEINIDKPIEWIQRERINTQKTIELKRIEVGELEQQILMRKDMHETKKSLILLGSYNDRNEYEELSIQINKLEAQRDGVRKEVSYLKNLLSRLQLENSNYKRIETRKKDFIETKYFYVAKLNGIIGQINYNENEICFRKEELLTVHKTNDVRIKAFFNPEDMKHLSEGDAVVINYPDNTNSHGIITNFHIATYALPDEFQKKYEPTERNIVAEVKLTDNTRKPVMNYYKMNVLITKNRFKL